MFISTIFLAECVYLVERGKIALDYKELFNKFEISNNFITVSLNLEIVKMLPEIKLPELHDRIIVATAKILGAKLITKDKDIVESRLVETIWAIDLFLIYIAGNYSIFRTCGKNII
ncbi:MAG: PIN domain-containing protein [Candidatus Aenigmarchaeota archaeon]|nr:PIN domain-containing protein [Candidatus Aenigmarchaeota archaeon]